MWTRAQIPLLRILLPFILGILIAGLAPSASQYWFAAGVIGVVTIIPTVVMKKKGHYFIWLAFIFLGVSVMGKVNDNCRVQSLSQKEKLRVGIITDKEKKAGKGLHFNISLFPQQLNVKTFTNLSHSAPYFIGDTIQFIASLDQPMQSTTPWGFDYRKYLNNQNTYFSTYLDSSKITKKKGLQKFSLSRLAQKWKEKTLSVLEAILPQDSNFALIKSVTFGDKNSLDYEIKNEMKTAGLMHIMAVSGFHIGIIYLFLLYFFFPLKKITGFRSILVILGIWIFILICGNPASAVRAGIMLTVYEIGKQFYDRPNKFNVLGISAFLILLVDPFQLYQIGFQFSFIALTGIFLFYQKINEVIISLTNLPEIVSSPISLSFAAQGMLAPLCLYYFGYVSYWFWVWSLIAIPLTIAIMVGSIMSISFALFSLSGIAKTLAYAPTFGARGLEWIGSFQSKLPIDGLVFHLPLYLMIGALLLLILIAINIHFKVNNRKAIILSSILFLSILSVHNTLKHNKKAVYVFSSFDGSHILIKNGNTAQVIGDKIGPRQQEAITAHLGITQWNLKEEDLFSTTMTLKMQMENNFQPIAKIVNLDDNRNNSDDLKSIPFLYSAPEWKTTSKSVPENGINILERTFTYENPEL